MKYFRLQFPSISTDEFKLYNEDEHKNLVSHIIFTTTIFVKDSDSVNLDSR